MTPTEFATDDLAARSVTDDPYGYFGWLRETDPVHWNELFGAWIVTSHRDVSLVARDHARFSADYTYMGQYALHPPVPEADLAELDFINQTCRPFSHRTRPEHLPMRQATHLRFTPRAVERWRPRVRARAQELVEECREEGAMDVKAHLASPLTVATIAWLLGVSERDVKRLTELNDTFMSPGFATDRLRRQGTAWREIRDYFAPLVVAREKEPKDDVISAFADAKTRGVFTLDECVANLNEFVLGGYKTTANWICNGLHAFLRNPSQWSLLRSDPEALCKPAIEECLRFEPTSKFSMRVCTQDVELGGKSLTASQIVYFVMSSANRDPRVFADPDRFDITRTPNPHLTFSAGIHHCLGAAFTRLEGQEVFRVLVETFQELDLANDEIEYPPNLSHREIDALQIRWP